MKKAVIIFGSTTGNTESVANTISNHLNEYESIVINVTEASSETYAGADLVLLGSSTWGYGELQDDFVDFYENEMESLVGMNVAVFGCGDEAGFTDVFCEAAKLIQERAEDFGATIVQERLSIDGEPSDNNDKIIAFVNTL